MLLKSLNIPLTWKIRPPVKQGFFFSWPYETPHTSVVSGEYFLWHHKTKIYNTVLLYLTQDEECFIYKYSYIPITYVLHCITLNLLNSGVESRQLCQFCQRFRHGFQNSNIYGIFGFSMKIAFRLVHISPTLVRKSLRSSLRLILLQVHPVRYSTYMRHHMTKENELNLANTV